MPKLMNILIQFQPLRKVLDKLMDKIQNEFEKKAEDEIKLNEENKST